MGLANQQSELLKQQQERLQSEIAYQQAQIAHQQFTDQQAQRDYLANRGIDYETNKPFELPKNLQQVAPNNKGKPATLDDQYAHAMGMAQWAIKTNQTNLGNAWLQQAQNISSERAQANSLNVRTALDYFNQGQMNERTQENNAGAYTRQGMRDETSASNTQDRLINALTIALLTGQNRIDVANIQQTGANQRSAAQIRQRYDLANTSVFKQYTAANDAATKAANKDGIPVVLPHPDLDSVNKGTKKAIQYVLDHPDKLAITIQGILKSGKDPVLLQASVNQVIQAAQAAQTGGSNASQNPTKGAIAPRQIWDMARQAGATPQEATTLTAIAQAESGGNPNQVNPNDNGGKQTSWGMFQISDGTHNEPKGWRDPMTNVRMAIQKLRSQGFGAWGTYNSGAYLQFMPGNH
jgi:hypothetical protein